MSSDHTVNELLIATRNGDATAPDRLFDRYFPRLVNLARQHLAGIGTAATDEEDVALSVMNSFFHALQSDRLPELQDHAGLARLLFRMTVRKAIDYRRREQRAKRGGSGRLMQSPDDSQLAAGIEAAPSAELPPDLVAAMGETLERLMGCLDDEALRKLVHAKLSGYTNREIALQLNCSLSTVERRLRLVRKAWIHEGTQQRDTI